MWVCKKHKKENEAALTKFGEELKQKGYNFVFISNMSSFGVSQEGDEVLPGKLAALTPQNKDVVQAIENLKKSAKGSTVLEVPPPSMFMFSRIKGKTRSLNTFYDDGCSDCVWKEGVPGNELKGIITQPGPFFMGGVGDTRVKANNEHLCLMELVDGSKQMVHGLSVDRITGKFPMFKLDQAAKEIKADAPQNKELQNLKVPPAVGGEVDCLLGIKYLKCHPVLVHSLASGLSIYRVRLASDDGFNAVIGGPHESFNFLAGKAGNTAQLITAFKVGINEIRSCGEFIAPRIKSNMLTIEEEIFAKSMNKDEVYDIVGEEEPDSLESPKKCGF